MDTIRASSSQRHSRQPTHEEFLPAVPGGENCHAIMFTVCLPYELRSVTPHNATYSDWTCIEIEITEYHDALPPHAALLRTGRLTLRLLSSFGRVQNQNGMPFTQAWVPSAAVKSADLNVLSALDVRLPCSVYLQTKT